MTENVNRESATSGIFVDPQALSAEKHGGLRLKKISNGFGFARAQHVVPVTAHEIPQMATHYPIIFVGPQNAPCAVMGLGEPVNLFVTGKGAFAEDAAPPAALRQYPFFLRSDDKNEQMMLCIDRSAPHFSETEGDLLFEDGEASKLSEGILQSLATLDQQRRVTAKFVEQLTQRDLLTTREMKGREPEKNGAAPRTVATYVSIDEQKLAELSDADRGELARQGFLPVCYAILLSQHNWRQLVRLAQKRGGGRKAE